MGFKNLGVLLITIFVVIFNFLLYRYLLPMMISSSDDMNVLAGGAIGLIIGLVEIYVAIFLVARLVERLTNKL